MNKQMERKSGQDRIAENVIYKRELNHSYMVLPCQDKDMAERYDYRIMQQNWRAASVQSAVSGWGRAFIL